MAQTVFQYLCLVRSSSAIDSLLPSVVCSLSSFRSRYSLNFMHFSISLWPNRRFSQLPPLISGPKNASTSLLGIAGEVDMTNHVKEGALHIGNKKIVKQSLNKRQGSSQTSGKAWGLQKDKKQELTRSILAILQEIETTDIRLEQASRLGIRLKDSLQPWHGQVKKNDARNILQSLEKNPPLAVSFFNWVRTQPAFVTDKYLLSTFMSILAKGKHFSLLENLLNDISSFPGGAVDAVTFNVVLKAFADARQFDKMLKTYNQMLATGVHPTEYTFSIVIRGLVKARRNHDAIKLFEDAKKSSCKLNQHLYGELITLYGTLNQPRKAAALLKEMTTNGQPPNVIVYTRLMQAYCRANLSEEALALLAEMKLKKASPDSHTYFTLVDYFSKQEDVEQTKYLFYEARCELGKKLDSQIYSVLIHMYVKIGQMSEAEDMVTTMKADGLTPDQGTYFVLLSGYAKREMFSAAKLTLATMKNDLGLVDTRIYTSLLTLCLECTSEEAVVSMVDCMEASGHWLHKVVLLLSMSPQALCLEESFWTGIANELKKLTIEPTALADHTIMSIVAFLTKLGSESRACRFWKEARKQDFLAGLQGQDGSSWKIDLHYLHPFAVKPVLLFELSHLRNILEAGNIPEEIQIVTGWGRGKGGAANGDSIQDRVSAILQQLHSPFHTIKKNGGPQTSRGQEVWIWLQSQRTRSWLA